jgi:hypothetical protein
MKYMEKKMLWPDFLMWLCSSIENEVNEGDTKKWVYNKDDIYSTSIYKEKEFCHVWVAIKRFESIDWEPYVR